MIGYVILITLAVVMGGIVYTWMKSYVPPEIEEGECDEGVSLFIPDSSCDIYEDEGSLQLHLTIKNNGRFNIGGYFIYAANETDQEIATIDLSRGIISGQAHLNPGVKFAGGKNSFLPTNKAEHLFIFDNPEFNNLTSIELVPIRWQTQDENEKVIACSSARIRESITCISRESGYDSDQEEWEYTGVNYSINDQDNNPIDIFWDGGFWWVLGDQNNKVYRYWPNWTYMEESYNVDHEGSGVSSLFWADGFWWVLNGGRVCKYWPNWTYTSEREPIYGGVQAMDIFYNESSWFLAVDGGDDMIFEYNSSWDNIENYSIGVQSNQPQSIFWDGTNWWVSDFGGGDQIYKYFANWTFTEETYSVSSQDTSPYDIFQDNDYWWMLGSTHVYQYEIGEGEGTPT